MPQQRDLWGANSCGQLGLGFKSEFEVSPREVGEHLKEVRCLVGGGAHSLLLTGAGEVFGVGSNSTFQLLQDVSNIPHFTKLIKLEEHHVVHIASEWETCFALTKDGLCLGWGSNSFGQLGLLERKYSEPELVGREVKAVSCGPRHTLLLTRNGLLLSAGDNKFGKLGRDPSLSSQSSFQLVPGLTNIKEIACGFNHSIALAENGEVFVWGSNKWGQLGKDPATLAWRSSPDKLTDLDGRVASVHAGWSSSHLVTYDGRVISFGRNNYGQLGHAFVPELKSWDYHILKNIRSLSVGSEHALALEDSGKLIAWGWNEHGNCGNGSTENQFSPDHVLIDNSLSVRQFSAISGHNFAILETKS